MGAIFGKIKKGAPAGEKKVYNLLTKLFGERADTDIYYQPFLLNNKLDFLLINPTFGVVILEVKDYSETNLCDTPQNGPWLSRNKNIEKPLPNPFNQIFEYWQAVRKKIASIQGVVCPVQQVVVLTNISRARERGLIILGNKPAKVFLFFKEDIVNIQRFREKFADIPHNLELNDEQFKLIKGNLIPTSRLPNLTQAKLSKFIADIDELKLLDRDQERLAQNLGAGHRLFFGVAGSGKTVLLIARARYLALRHPDWRILILCYNRLLAKYLQRLVIPQDYGNIEIYTFHKWAKDTIMAAGFPYNAMYNQEWENCKEKSVFFTEFVPKLLLDVLNLTKSAKYEAILIDEAQDFEASWFKPIMQGLNPETNSLLITCDGLQSIYDRKKYHWSDVGIRAQGRTKKLQKSYRNPREIGRLAAYVLPKNLQELIGTRDEFLETREYIRPGGLVEFAIKEDRTAEYVFIIDKIKAYLQKGWDILVIFRKNLKKEHYNHEFISLLNANNLIWTDLSNRKEITGHIILGTPQGTKGLESDVVCIPEIDTYYRSTDQQLLYVGMTRALRSLILTASKETPLVKSLLNYHLGRNKESY
ncbi:MAG: NERD domain-containing protein [Candidatus Helarchaeota archaeon]